MIYILILLYIYFHHELTLRYTFFIEIKIQTEKFKRTSTPSFLLTFLSNTLPGIA